MSFDLRDRLSFGVNDIGAGVSFGEASDLVKKLADTPGTWTHAELNGWAWPATFPELAAISHAEGFINVNRDIKVEPDVIRIPRPWTERDDSRNVTAEERAALRARLIASSPFVHD